MTLVKKEKFEFYETPKFPDFPDSEWQARINKAQKLMAENEMDCLVLWSRPNIRYFSGFQTTHWTNASIQPAVEIIPADREPVFIVPSLLLGSAEGLSWVRDIRAQENPHQTKSEREFPKEIANVIKELGYGRKNIGLEMGYLGCMWIPRPLNDIEVFKNALPDAKFVDGDKVIWGCRMIKSPLEIERIRKSVEAIGAIESALVEGYEPGMTEVDLAKILHLKAAGLEGAFLGDDSIALRGHLTCSIVKEPMFDIGALEGVTISKGDRISFDMRFWYKGYSGDSARTFEIGPITDRIKEIHELMSECEDRAANILRPGTKPSELHRAVSEPIKAAGFPIIEMVGHGVGLDPHEPPVLDDKDDMLIEEGMVLSIEPWIIGDFQMHGGEGVFGIQDQFVVTKKGCYMLEGLRRDIIQVSHPIL